MSLEAGQKVFKIKKNVSYQVFKNLDMMRFCHR